MGLRESIPSRLELGACVDLSKARQAWRPAHPPRVSLDMLDMSAVEKIGCGAPVKSLSALPSTEPFELMTLARTEAAPDWSELELPESTEKPEVAPELGP